MRVMRGDARLYFLVTAIIAVGFIFPAPPVIAEDSNFHNAPANSVQKKNPYTGQSSAAAGSRLYATNCGSCHGIKGRGTANMPALDEGPTQSASDGEIFWFITTGATDKGMPSWASLPERQRWQIVTYLKSLKGTSASTTN